MRLKHIDDNWVVHAPAKLNLFLEVIGKRADGYHDIETVMAAVDLHDTLVFRATSSDEIVLRCHHSGSHPAGNSAPDFVPEGSENLVVRAAELLRAQGKLTSGIRIDLFKRIPAAAGMAGGSSNAAASLFALNQLWNLRLDLTELQQLASQLGSDVSFFLSPSPLALCQGRGEILRPIHSPARLHFVIVRPESGLSTALVYKHCVPEPNPRGAEGLIQSLQRGDLKKACELMCNSLQRPAELLNSEIHRLKAAFSKLPVCGHMMTGSGTAYFGVCQNRLQAMTAAARLKAWGLGRVFVAASPP